MKEINSSKSTEFFWKELAFTYVRLKGNSKTKHLAPAVLAHLKKYDEDIVRTDRETEWSVIEEQAHTKSVEERVEKHLRDVQTAVMFLVKQNSKDVRYRNLFEISFSLLLRLKPQDQKDAFERMKVALTRGDYEDAFRDEQIELLDKVLGEIDSVQVQQSLVADRQYAQQTAVKQWKDDANVVRREIYGDLLKFPESSNTSWIKGFFRVVRKAPKMTAEQKAKKDADRAKKKLEKATAAYDYATSESMKAAYKVDMEQAKAELDAKYKSVTKKGETQSASEPTSEPTPGPTPGSTGSGSPQSQTHGETSPA